MRARLRRSRHRCSACPPGLPRTANRLDPVSHHDEQCSKDVISRATWRGRTFSGSAANPTRRWIVAGRPTPTTSAGLEPLEAGMSDISIGDRFPGRKSQAVSHGAGPLPDEGCAGAGHLRRQGQEPAQPGRLVLPQDGRRRPPDLRLDRRGRRRRVPGRRQRGRRPA